MGCFHTKVTNNAVYNDDFSGLDIYNSVPAPIDYTNIVTKDITNLRNKVKEFSTMPDDKEAFLKSLFAHADELYPKPQLKEDSDSSKKKTSVITDDARWNKGVGFGNAGHETKKDQELKALLLQKEINFTSLLESLLKHLPQLQEQRRLLTKRATSSSFMYIVENLCYNDSILDMTQHAFLYKALLNLIDAFARDQVLRVLVFQKTGPRPSDKPLRELLKDMNASASVYFKLSGALGGEAGDPVSRDLAKQITVLWENLQRIGARLTLANSGDSSAAAPSPRAEQEAREREERERAQAEQARAEKEAAEKAAREKAIREAEEKAAQEKLAEEERLARERQLAEDAMKAEKERVEKERERRENERRQKAVAAVAVTRSAQLTRRATSRAALFAALASGTEPILPPKATKAEEPEEKENETEEKVEAKPEATTPAEAPPAPTELKPEQPEEVLHQAPSEGKGKGAAVVEAEKPAAPTTATTTNDSSIPVPPPPPPAAWKAAQPSSAAAAPSSSSATVVPSDPDTMVSVFDPTLMPPIYPNYDEYGNVIHEAAKPEQRKPHALLQPYVDNPALLKSGPKLNYCDALREHLFGNATINVSKHYHSSYFEKAMAKPKMNRLLSELGSLSRSLPLSEGSSVFLRCDEKRIDVMKALIIGPQGTPYQNGCFVFDVYLPAAYPNTPPLFQLRTTGGGTVRFNPNLYADGKVCLSLLGTWQGEPWRPTSTLLQVLVSIQSLILVPHPYFNEPGWEPSQGTAHGKIASKNYNDNLLGATVQWGMWQHLVQPDEAFGDVIAAHLYLKRNEIRAQLIEWQKTTNVPALLQDPIAKLLPELDKLEKNPPALVKSLL